MLIGSSYAGVGGGRSQDLSARGKNIYGSLAVAGEGSPVALALQSAHSDNIRAGYNGTRIEIVIDIVIACGKAGYHTQFTQSLGGLGNGMKLDSVIFGWTPGVVDGHHVDARLFGSLDIGVSF